MRVLQVTEASASGTFEVARRLCEAVVDDGGEVTFVCGRRPETAEDLAAEVASGVELVPLAWDRRNPTSHLRAASTMRRLVEEWKPDVVHLHSAFAGVVGALALGRQGVPIAYTPHGSPLGRGDGKAKLAAYARLEGLVAGRAAVVGAVSQAEADLLERIAAPDKVVVIPNGIRELDEDRLPTPRPGRSGVVAVGRIVAERDPAGTAEILGALAADGPVMWLGDGSPEAIEPVRSAGVPVSGWLSRDEVLDRLADAMVLVHWSASDGASLVILEAMAHDVVVVASAIGPNRELLGDEQTCRTTDEAIALVRRVLTDDDQRERFLVQQHERRLEHSATRMCAQWLELYHRLAAGEPITSPLGSGSWT